MTVFLEYHRRFITKIAAIILISSTILIGLNYYSIKILSSIRAFVNGESEYSKGQKDATHYLVDFIQTSNIKSYKSFKEELSVPIGCRTARVLLQNKGAYDETFNAFLRGRNHPDDIPGMIWIFKAFQDFKAVNNIVKKWENADSDIAELERIGQFVFDLKNEQLDPAVKEALIINVNTINRRLTFSQQAFSNILGQASRVITHWLILINVFFILLILITAGVFAKNMIKQLMNSKRKIIEQNMAKDEFMSIASHELKTPITSMKASLQILGRMAADKPENRAMHPFIMNSNKQVNRLSGLVADLLDVTKIQSGKLALNKKPFLINDLVNEVVEETTQLSSHEIIIKEIPKIYVNADAGRIYQVIDNLLSNAAKYSVSAGKIEVYAEVNKGDIKICVKDFGPGISSHKLPLLFDRYYRIDETKQTVQGLGLGLYICKEIITNHQGEIGVESTVGEGSVFWFSLPVVKVFHGVTEIIEPVASSLLEKNHEQVI